MATTKTGYKIYPTLRKVVSGGPNDGQPLDANNNLCSVTGLPQATMANPTDSGTYKQLDDSCNNTSPNPTIPSTPAPGTGNQAFDQEFDFMVIQYDWTNAAGGRLNNLTGFIETNTVYDEEYVGKIIGGQGVENDWEYSPRFNPTAYLQWSRYNLVNSNVNSQSVLVRFKDFIQAQNPVSNLIKLDIKPYFDMYTRLTGQTKITFRTFSGGSMFYNGTTKAFENSGGVAKTVISRNVVAMAEESIFFATRYPFMYESKARVEYNKTTKKAQLIVL